MFLLAQLPILFLTSLQLPPKHGTSIIRLSSNGLGYRERRRKFLPQISINPRYPLNQTLCLVLKQKYTTTKIIIIKL